MKHFNYVAVYSTIIYATSESPVCTKAFYGRFMHKFS